MYVMDNEDGGMEGVRLGGVWQWRRASLLVDLFLAAIIPVFRDAVIEEPQ